MEAYQKIIIKDREALAKSREAVEEKFRNVCDIVLDPIREKYGSELFENRGEEWVGGDTKTGRLFSRLSLRDDSFAISVNYSPTLDGGRVVYARQIGKNPKESGILFVLLPTVKVCAQNLRLDASMERDIFNGVDPVSLAIKGDYLVGYTPRISRLIATIDDLIDCWVGKPFRGVF